MLKVDEFESAFRSADKKVFHLDPPEVKRVLIVTDLSSEGLFESEFPSGDEGKTKFVDAVRKLLAALGDDVEFSAVHGDDYSSDSTLL